MQRKRPHGLTTGGRETEGKVPPVGRIRKFEPERKASAETPGPKHAQSLRRPPWRLKVRTSEEEDPPPEECTDEQGHHHYGGYYDLWKLGVPLDFEYPVDFSPPPSIYPDEDDRALAQKIAEMPSRKDWIAEYEQKTRKPLLKKALQLTIRLQEAMEVLIEVERQHPRYRISLYDEPFTESSHIHFFSEIEDSAKFASRDLHLAGYVKRGRRSDTVRNQIVKSLGELGLGDTKIGKALRILGFRGNEDPGLAKDRVRKYRKRGQRTVGGT